jgi:hypothetical protein
MFKSETLLKTDTPHTDLLAYSFDETVASAYPDIENPFRCEINELQIRPFTDWLPELKHLKDFGGVHDSAGNVFRQK